VVVIARAVRSQQNDIGTEVGKWMAPVATGRAEEQLVDDVQPGKVRVRRGHLGEAMSDWHQVQVESVFRVGGSRAT
jgi:hypothetical protein